MNIERLKEQADKEMMHQEKVNALKEAAISEFERFLR